MSKDNPRIAVLGFAIECNRFSPVSTAADFEQDVDIRGNRIVSEARSGASITMPDLPGFFTEMDRTGPWTPVPLRVSLAQPGGPVEESFFKDFLTEIDAGLKAALPLDAVFISATARRWPRAPTIPTATCSRSSAASSARTCRWSSVFDLHANVSRKMIDNLSVFVGYLENPHTDIHERGIEAAKHMRECLGRPAHRHHHGQGAAGAAADHAADRARALCRPDQVRPDQGRRRHHERLGDGGLCLRRFSPRTASPPWSPRATATATAAAALSLDIAKRAWDMKERFKRAMMSLGDAVQLAASVGRDRRRKPIILADVADNPGGGGARQHHLSAARAEERRCAAGVIFGVFNDAAVAAKAHELGEGAIFTASFNTQEHQRILPAVRLRGQGA